VELLARLAPVAPTAYHRLNPLTKATAAAAVSGAAILLGGYVAPLVLLFGVVLPSAAVARVLGRTVRLALAVSAPILISVVLVSVFTRAGSTVLFQVGPFDATLEGVDFAARITLRLLVLAMALVLFGLTTESRSLVADLERRGVSPRLTFAVAATLEAVPAMIERARNVAAAQRARGLDTQGSVGARLRGIDPLAVPVVISAVAEVEERSLALEARAFDRPGRRMPLWAPADSPGQRLARWLVVAVLVAVVVARAGGLLAGLP
jgi:energy-coupling factor transport system permease protein